MVAALEPLSVMTPGLFALLLQISTVGAAVYALLTLLFDTAGMRSLAAKLAAARTTDSLNLNILHDETAIGLNWLPPLVSDHIPASPLAPNGSKDEYAGGVGLSFVMYAAAPQIIEIGNSLVIVTAIDHMPVEMFDAETILRLIDAVRVIIQGWAGDFRIISGVWPPRPAVAPEATRRPPKRGA